MSIGRRDQKKQQAIFWNVGRFLSESRHSRYRSLMTSVKKIPIWRLSIPSQMWLSSYPSDIRNHLLIKVESFKVVAQCGQKYIGKEIYFPIYLLMGHKSCTSRCAGDSQIWWKQGNSVTNSSDWEILGFTISQHRICKRHELDVNITISSNQRQIEWNQIRLEKIECNQMFQNDIDMQV